MNPPRNTNHLRDLTIDELRMLVLARGEPEYRFRQLCRWLYVKLAADVAQMTDLPLPFREALGADFTVSAASPLSVRTSRLDGTRKYLFEMADGARAEAVLMHFEKRTTLCVSTQVGCPMDCLFCATAKGGFERNLTAGEMLDQVCSLKADAGLAAKKVNVVFMGMGEPMLNFDSLLRALGVLNDPLGLNLGSKRVTVSTSGFPDRIRRLADAGVNCSLALSLNAPNDAKRARLMPKASRHPIAELLDAARYFVRNNGRRVTIEYVLLAGHNMSEKDADQLGRLVAGSPFKLNLIPYNPSGDETFGRVTERELQRFVQRLLPVAPTLTVRRSRGTDIEAACGQLWSRGVEKSRDAGDPTDSSTDA